MVRPIGDRLQVMPVDEDDYKTEGGLIVQQDDRVAKALKMEVVSVGDGCKRQWSKGDIIFVPQHSATDVKETPVDKSKFVAEDDILGVIEPS